MVTEERAVKLVEALLSKKRQEALAKYGKSPEVVVLSVEEHALGWLVGWQSVEYIRSRDPLNMLVGSGPYLVDRQDGSIHHIPVVTFVVEDWEELYLWQVKGVRRPEPLMATVRALLQADGTVTAMRHLRKHAPALGLSEAKEYVMVMLDGGDPPEELMDLTRTPDVCSPLRIETLAGPPQQ
ncbi:YrhB domain-containing protein [Kitasatospora sp. NPDC092286]|uniref:YrhB domain-containing protein n=1 Tax=Kitasatospora sp. NPDC092286 TaxID=3364087 RepID=UPI00381423F5